MSTTSTVRVVVVEDHPVTRMGVVALPGQDERIEVVGEAGAGEDALGVVAREHPDVVVTDLRLGDGLDGVGVTSAVRGTRPAPAVLVLTTYDTDRDIVRAVEAGAAGYLLKDADPARITDAVIRAAAGGTVLSPDLAQRVVARISRPQADLSAREVEILAAVARGLSNREIARSLVISEATVKTHLVHVFTKLDVDSRTAAVARAREDGLIP
ncbi:response regulator transcription factor [Janibacter indicus]|uniref:Response regulator transcription factor n=1 Tax=Janibacter indicus TaxID=857417 RepID=A0A7L9IXJ3_9MICO|nr:response regulator transcription factor [Janibacter indicus]QOK21702.1 response regulator transcription factor [Janibacter indicus]